MVAYTIVIPLLVLLLCVAVSAAEGRDDLVRQLWLELLSGAGVRGLLLHGMGGVGKSTLATLLAHHLEKAGAFPGGVYMVSVQTRAQYAAHEDTLLAVQLELLGAISQNNERKPSSLDVGAQLLEDELCRISKNENDAPRRVLLVIDNVPEGGSGIGELLPQDLQGCLADG